MCMRVHWGEDRLPGLSDSESPDVLSSDCLYLAPIPCRDLTNRLQNYPKRYI